MSNMESQGSQADSSAINAGTSYVGGDGFPLPAPDNIIPRPLTTEEEARIDTLSRLQFFLATAPTRWTDVSQTSSRITKFQLPNSECISCILWNGLYHITGTDIVRALAFRFEAFGRPIHATKKWEEGVFSDLRNLKPGQDACLEEPKSPLLDFLFRNGCIRTQKKQKVFYWFSVPHDRLFLDALERDLKREKVNQEPTSIVVGEPARSFKYDPRRSLYDQFAGQNPGLGGNYFVPGQPQQMGSEYGAPPQDPYYGGPPPMPLSLQPPPHAAGPSMGGMPPQGQPGYAGYHPSFPPGGSMHGQPPMAPPPHGLPVGMGVPPHMRSDMSPAPHPMGPPVPRGPPGYVGFRPSAPLEGSPHYKRRRSRLSRSPAVRSVVAGHDEEGSPAPAGADDSFASESMGASRKKPRSVSRAASVAASGVTGRSGSVDSAGELRMYPCPYSNCRRPFRRLEHLRRHVRTHTQERPFWCTRCPKKFARQDNLTNHLRVHEKHDGSGADGDASAEYDMDASEYEEEEGMNLAALPREWSGSPANVMSDGSVSGLSYNRHSTLPPKFPPNFAMFNPGLPPAAGTGTPGPVEFTPYQPGGMSNPMYPSNLGMGAPMDTRRHRSATPYAPVNSSNLAYAQPVTSGSWSSDAYAAPPPPDFGASADMTSSTSGSGMASYPPIGGPAITVPDQSYRASSIDPAQLHMQPMPLETAGMNGNNGYAPIHGANGETMPGMGGAYVSSSTPLTAPIADMHSHPHLSAHGHAQSPGPPTYKSHDGMYLQPNPAIPLHPQQLHITVPTPTTAGTLMPTTAMTGVSIADSLLSQNGKGPGMTIGVPPVNGDGVSKGPGSASKVPSGWGWKSAPTAAQNGKAE